ncbi:hypothetical protein [Tsuneonella sp. HG222]
MTQVSAFPAADPLDGTEKIPIDQGGFGRHLDIAELATYFGANRRIFTSQIVGTALTESEVLLTLTPPDGETWTFPGNLVGSVGLKTPDGTNPADTYPIDLVLDGDSTGSITISDTGVVTFATTDGDPIVLVGGTNILQAVGPATVDPLAVGYVLTLVATFSIGD